MRFGLLILFCCTLLALGITGDAGARANSSSLEGEFGAAADEFRVPEELLLAMGYVNTRLEMPPPEASDHEPANPGEGAPEARGTYGIMQLAQNPSEDSLGEAANLTGIPEERLKTDRTQNIRGGAALLAGELEDNGRPEDLNGWYGAVARYGGGGAYAEQVYEVLKKGAFTRVSSGERVEIPARRGVVLPQSRSLQAAGEYPGSTWYGASSSNYTAANRPGSGPIDKIVVHVTQGSFSGALSWFNDTRAGASAHYTVRSSDGAVGQSVAEEDIGWHAGNWPYNETSIGIEHEGYVSDPKWFTDAMYRSSAKLSAYLAKKYGIPIDRAHIIGHGQIPYPNDHTDPGTYWDWNKYIGYVKQYAGETSGDPTPGAAYSQTVDNSNERRFSADSGWGTSAYSTQRYSSNYRFAEPGEASGPARFRFKIPATGTYDVYGWWPADPGYNDQTTFRVQTASGWRSKTVSQRTNGGRWVRLGAYTLQAGKARYVEVSNTSPGTGYVIADAVKVVSRQ